MINNSINRLNHNVIFYIYAPFKKRNAAGSIALWELTNLLKNLGYHSEVICHSWKFLRRGNRKFQGELTFIKALLNILKRKTVIVIYPESVTKNLLGAKNPLWYLMAMPGELYNKSSEIFEKRLTFSFTENLKNAWKSEGPVVHFPLVDLDELSKIKNRAHKTDAEIAYAGKYAAIYHGVISNLPEVTEVLQRKVSTQLSREDFLLKLANSRLLHCYENTNVAFESLLLGTPVKFHLNQSFENLIMLNEFGASGVIIEGTPYDHSHAFESIGQVEKKYLEYLERFDYSPFIFFLEYNISQSKRDGFQLGPLRHSVKFFRVLVHRVYFGTIFVQKFRSLKK